MEQEKNITVITAVDGGDRRPNRLLLAPLVRDAFAGWGPRMESSSRDILRGLN